MKKQKRGILSNNKKLLLKSNNKKLLLKSNNNFTTVKSYSYHSKTYPKNYLCILTIIKIFPTYLHIDIWN